MGRNYFYDHYNFNYQIIVTLYLKKYNEYTVKREAA